MTAPVSSDLAWLDDLQRAHAAATKGPWRQHPSDRAYVIGEVSEDGEEYLDVADTAPSTSPGGWEQAEANSAAIVALHNAVPTLIAELRKRDAALRAVEGLAEKADRKVRESVPASSAERLIAEGAHPVRVGDLRSTLTAALSPESVMT